MRLLKEAEQASAGEYLKELAKAFTKAHRYGSAFAADRPMRWYFEGKAEAFRSARSKTVKILAEEFETARYNAHREAPDGQDRQRQRGLSAGFAEAAALAKLTNAFRNAVRA